MSASRTMLPTLRTLISSSSSSSSSRFVSHARQLPRHYRLASTISQRPIIPASVTSGSKGASPGEPAPSVAADNQAARAEVSLKRFWKTVGIMEQPDGKTYFVTLDGRPLRTPSGNRLAIPKSRRVLAMLIANEWENQKEVLKVNALPMTSLAARALDAMTDEATKEGVLEQLMRYLDTDTTLFPDERPSTLVRLQKEHWEPLHADLSSSHSVAIEPYTEIVRPAGSRFEQPAETRETLKRVVLGWDEWQLAALERAVYATKSFLIAFALVSGRLTADQAARAAHVEVTSNIELWGEVEDSHDVDYQDIRRQLGSAACLLSTFKA